MGDYVDGPRLGPIYQWGRTVAEAVKVPGSERTDWLLLYRVQPSGKISYRWVVVASQYETDFD